MCDAEPERPDRHQSRDQPLPRVRRCACDRPQRAAGADEPDAKTSRWYRPSRNCRCAAAPSRRPPSGSTATPRSPANASRYKTVMRNPANRLQTSKIYEIRTRSKPGFTPKFPVPPQSDRNWPFFPAPLCHIGGPKAAPSQRMTSANAFRPLFPLRDGDRTDQAVLAADFPGADAGVPGAVRAGHGRALQADRHRLLRQSRPQRADRRGAADRHHPVVPPGDPALSGSRLGQQFPHRRSRPRGRRGTRRCWRRWRRSSAASAPGG